MSHTPPSFFLLGLALVGCLDPHAGIKTDSTVVLARCDLAVAPLELLARDVGGAALGRCGHVGVWRETAARALELYRPDHTRAGRVAGDNGFGGEVAFSPSEERMVAWSLESDLGFGTANVYQTYAELVPVASIHFQRSPTLAFGAGDELTVAAAGFSGGEGHIDAEDGTHIDAIEPLAYAGHQVIYMPTYMPTDTGAMSRALFAFDIDLRTSQPLGEIAPGWRQVDAASQREVVQLSGDGRRVVIARECSLPNNAACPTALLRVVDTATGQVLVAPEGWTEPRVGAGMLVAAAVSDGIGTIAADRVVRTLAARELVSVMAAHVLVRRGELIEAVDPLTGFATVLGSGSKVSVSDGGRAALVASKGPKIWTFHLWGSDRDVASFEWAPSTPTDRTEPKVVVLFDDGVSIIADGLTARVIGAEGREVHRWDGPCVQRPYRSDAPPSRLRSVPLRRDRFLFAARCSALNGLLVRVDLESGEERVLAEGNTFEFEADASGQVIAFTYQPLSGTVRELHAGLITP